MGKGLSARVQSTIEPAYNFTFFCPTSSDITNQLVAAQCPVLQNEIVSVSSFKGVDAASFFASLAETTSELFGSNQVECSTLTAPFNVPGVFATW